MTVTLIDSNVLLDIATEDPKWSSWSENALIDAADDGALAINPIIYAEVSVGFRTIEDLDDAIPTETFTRMPLPFEAGFLAGKAFLHYRRRGGVKLTPLPDFYIGAHAAIAGYRLLTRDAARYRTYYPSLDIIAPTD
jgi:predicted nucleic acid-binding protein